MAQTELLDLAPRARTRRGPSAPALPSATRRGGRTHRYAEPRSPPEIAGLPPRGAIFGPLVQTWGFRH